MNRVLRALIILALSLISGAAYSEENKVTKVYVCGTDVGIYIENVGWLVAKESAIGQSGVDRILSMALSLASSNMKPGYLNPGESFNWCGISNARPITVLQVVR
ncbi:MAG: hypothetical protein KZQ75_05345 [Candidatus Thiodiazotropha sp. (ex Myrtea spinifera)]|nr:hypothetical protein [Candidatus Thiodiazotropha sp. (ex Myrtea spinifera)]